jgi:hypothetical protein
MGSLGTTGGFSDSYLEEKENAKYIGVLRPENGYRKVRDEVPLYRKDPFILRVRQVEYRFGDWFC